MERLRSGQHTYTLLKSCGGIEIFRRDDDKYCVIRRVGAACETIIPGDMPRWGGRWFGPISYVAGGYSRSYAVRKFNELTR